MSVPSALAEPHCNAAVLTVPVETGRELSPTEARG